MITSKVLKEAKSVPEKIANFNEEDKNPYKYICRTRG